MVILGIDPGLNATGYGVISADERHLQIVAAGVITPPARQSLARRLLQLHEALDRIIAAHRPTLMVLEAIFTHHQYLTTATLMAHARGVACLAGAQHQLQLVEYLPTRVKKAVTGHGAASKPQIAKAVGMWLDVDTAGWASDVTDALAVAIAHAHINTHIDLPLQGVGGRLAPSFSASLGRPHRGRPSLDGVSRSPSTNLFGAEREGKLVLGTMAARNADVPRTRGSPTNSLRDST